MSLQVLPVLEYSTLHNAIKPEVYVGTLWLLGKYHVLQNTGNSREMPEAFRDWYLYLELFSYLFRPHEIPKDPASERCISSDHRKLLFIVLWNCAKFRVSREEKISSNPIAYVLSQRESLTCEQSASWELLSQYTNIKLQWGSYVPRQTWKPLYYAYLISLLLFKSLSAMIRITLSFNFGAPSDRSGGFWDGGCAHRWSSLPFVCRQNAHNVRQWNGVYANVQKSLTKMQLLHIKLWGYVCAIKT